MHGTKLQFPPFLSFLQFEGGNRSLSSVIRADFRYLTLLSAVCPRPQEPDRGVDIAWTRTVGTTVLPRSTAISISNGTVLSPSRAFVDLRSPKPDFYEPVPPPLHRYA